MSACTCCHGSGDVPNNGSWVRCRRCAGSGRSLTADQRRTVSAIRRATGMSQAEAVHVLRRAADLGVRWEAITMSRLIAQSAALDAARWRTEAESESE